MNNYLFFCVYETNQMLLTEGKGPCWWLSNNRVFYTDTDFLNVRYALMNLKDWNVHLINTHKELESIYNISNTTWGDYYA